MIVEVVFHRGSTNFSSIMASICTPMALKTCIASSSCASLWTRGRLLPCNFLWPGGKLSEITRSKAIQLWSRWTCILVYFSASYGKVLRLLWMVRHSGEQLGKGKPVQIAARKSSESKLGLHIRVCNWDFLDLVRFMQSKNLRYLHPTTDDWNT